MENKKEFIINIVYYAIIIGLVFLFCNYLLGILAPFIFGFMFAYAAINISNKLFKKDTKLFRSISLVIFYILVVGIIAILAALGISELMDFIKTIPTIYKQYVEPVINNTSITPINNGIIENLQLDINEITADISNSINTLLSNVSSYIVSKVTVLISNTTSILIAILTTLITSFFVVFDYEEIFAYFESLMSDDTKKVYFDIKDFLLNTVFLVIKSYCLIMFVTFAELLVGLMIIGIPNFALISMAIAILDILPILGVGTVLIPWGIFEIIIGNVSTGIMIIVLYLIITFVRNIIEPKIVGGNLGLHPLATLFSMLLGLELFGILGMFGLPLFLSFFMKRKTA